MFSAVLVANRGEIACRIIRTLHRLGIRAVAVHSEADRDAMHAQLADEAFLIGPPAAAESYLRIDRILEAAARSGAEAVHPGYGFLSENAAFARACADASLTFIGPEPETIELMGEKDRAKARMEAAGIPVIPGRALDDADPAAAARELDYPVLVKATAGGGGRGMRVVRSESELATALESARRESRHAFGDDRMILERYLEDPRHIEVQVFGDGQGQVVYLYERDCSVQRRHQKLVEEAPAPGLRPPLRAAICDAATRVARAVGYTGAGTVEFLLSQDEAFYFMEMNTRIQVEHPATEMITGIDLVEWQVRVAAGEPLPLPQERIAARGHAIEVRLCAEDPRHGFVPATGLLERLRLPPEADDRRIDRGVVEGDRITPHYDSLFAKVIVGGEDRAAAVAALAASLERIGVAGVETNLDVLARIVGHPEFVAGSVGTGWLEARLGELTAPWLPDAPTIALAALWLIEERRRASEVAAGAGPEPSSPWHRTDGWRLNDRAHQTVRLRCGTGEVEIHAMARSDGHDLRIDGAVLRAALSLSPTGEGRLTVDGRSTPVWGHRSGDRLTLRMDGRTHRFDVVDPLAAASETETGSGAFTAPMPGRVVRAPVAPGDEVDGGAALLVLEAMKMEHIVRAPGPGKVVALHVAEGDQVDEGLVLLDFAPDAVA